MTKLIKNTYTYNVEDKEFPLAFRLLHDTKLISLIKEVQ